MSNPFSDVGGIVGEGRFRGRADEIRLLSDRLLGEVAYGSIAVIGMPRVGKSSLVQYSLVDQRASLAARKIIVCRIEVGTQSSWWELFTNLVVGLTIAARGSDLSTSAIEKRHSSVIDASQEELFDAVRSFCEELRRDGIRGVCILDEFDSARRVFATAPRCFHWLRELASNPAFKLALVVVSKRELGDIARVAGHESDYWANVLATCYVRGFGDKDLGSFFGAPG